ncbi:MAG: RtcB family protein [Clostridium sp.]|nr:RtcB family protein [Clostridium sp.]
MKLNGQTTSAEIFAENIDPAALDWVRNLCDEPAMEGIPVVQMPDVHAGTSCNVGTAYPVGRFVNPDHVGVDIGCTISAHRLSRPVSPGDFPLLDHRIREAVPTGAEVCARNQINEKDLFRFLSGQYQRARSCAPDLVSEVARIDARFVSDLCRRIKLQEGLFYKSLGTLGGGNHFIEYGEDTASGDGWVSVHCGSRNLGAKVAAYWHNVALNPRRAELPGWLSGELLRGYLSDMVVAQSYALYNHQTIHDRIFGILGKLSKAKPAGSIVTTHNYIDLCAAQPMLRKGSVDAGEGLDLVIPFNMRDGMALCRGKGNALWLNTAPHGAGRLMSRAQARKQIGVAEFETSMEGIFSTSVCAATLDESPMAYKDTEEILRQIEPTVEVVSIVKPKLNIKDKG